VAPLTKVPTLVQFDRALRDRLDAWAAEWCGSNRSAAIAQAVEQLLAADARYRQESQRREPPRGGWLPTQTRHSADSVADLTGRPITSDLEGLR
jgi:hypothetical protein